MHTLHRTSRTRTALRRALILGLCGAGLAGCVTVTTSSGNSGGARSANEPASAQPARSLPTQGQGGTGARSASTPAAPGPAPSQQPARAYTLDSLADVYVSQNESDFGFELILMKDGSSRMAVTNGDQLTRIHGRWSLQGDRITIEQKVGKKNERLVYVVREALKPASLRGDVRCKGSFGLEAVSVSEGEDRAEFFVWPKKAVMAQQAPCRK